MRARLAALALTGLALFTAAPAALAQHPGDAAPPDPAAKAARIIAAADKFDRKATGMRTRATKLRATALDLRREAADLMSGDEMDPTDDTAEKSRMDDGQEQEQEQEQSPVDPQDDPPAEDPCSWDGEDDLGFSRQHPSEETTDDKPTWDEEGAFEEACDLIRMAERFEARADALDAAATRMGNHACKLREKAARILDHAGENRAEQLLARAAAFRTKANRIRAAADRLRDGAFEGGGVDEDDIARIRRMELRAAAFDVRADRFEARARGTLA